ncbi:MAG: hypothetical protein K6G81_04510 [Lachnospiraceae bacterium]|nr:hypothetical protein [Lachnospiraceae bacterium]
MKKAKIALIISLVALIALVVVYIISIQEEKPVYVSQREQYQQQLINNGNSD